MTSTPAGARQSAYLKGHAVGIVHQF